MSDQRREDEHNTQGVADGDSDADTASGGSPEAPDSDDAPLGGDDTTQEELEADNPVEQDTLKTLDPEAPPA